MADSELNTPTHSEQRMDFASNGIWWDAETIEAMSMAMCWSEFAYPPAGETADAYWRRVSENTRKLFRKAAHYAAQAATPRVQRLIATQEPNHE